MKSRFRTTAFLFVAALILSALPSYAATITFDNTGPTTGTVSYAGGAAPLVGTNIDSWNIVQVSGTGSTDGTYYCQNCTLNFTTGANILSSPSVYTWAGGGSFTVTGTIWTDPTSATGSVIASGTLLTGSFTQPVGAVGFAALGVITIQGIGTDTKNAGILSYFNLNQGFVYASTNITASSCTPAAGTNAFGCNSIEGDITNTGTTAVPEPASMMLLGSGLLGLGYKLRRRRVRN